MQRGQHQTLNLKPDVSAAAPFLGSSLTQPKHEHKLQITPQTRSKELRLISKLIHISALEPKCCLCLCLSVSVCVSVSVSVSVCVSLAWGRGHGQAQADTGPQALPDQQRSCPCLSVICWFPSNTFLSLFVRSHGGSRRWPPQV